MLRAMQTTEDTPMRAILVAMLLALGLGLVGTVDSRAAPVAGAGLVNAIEDLSVVEVARYHSRWRCHRNHYRHSRWHRSCHHY